jgi:hypothetical protein
MDFTSLLSKNIDNVERPKPLPIGSYQFQIARYEFGESREKKTPFIRFFNRPAQPMDDVDTELLPPNWNEREVRLDFYLTDEAIYRLKDFLEHLGLRISGRTFDTVIPETLNGMFVGYISHDVRGENTYANISKTAPVS